MHCVIFFLQIWAGRKENFDEAVDMAGRLAKANALAQLGTFEGPHPSICGASSLHETNRGWRPKNEEFAGATTKKLEAVVPDEGGATQQ